jgi:hypothetical protein
MLFSNNRFVRWGHHKHDKEDIMLLRKMKKWSGMQLAALLVFAAFTVVLGACPSGAKTTIIEEEDDDGDTDDETLYIEVGDPTNYQTTKTWGTSFTPVTLGLTPGNDTTEINVNWYSTTAAGNNETHVRFIRGTREAGYAIHEVKGTATATTDSAGNLAHKVTVKGLKPGFNYQYSVSNDETNWSPMYDYKIPRPTGAWKFAVIADPQLHASTWDALNRYTPAAEGSTSKTSVGWLDTMAKIVAAGVSFIASGGDQVDSSSKVINENEYNLLFAPAGLRNLPLAPVSGNHDAHEGFMYHYNLPNEQKNLTGGSATDIQKMGNYFYLYNNILFVVLNTAPYPTSTETAAPYIGYFRQTLQAATTAVAKSKYDWLIVQHHKSTASVADHCADRDIQYYVEAGFETLMSEFKVDFVLAGHDHVYARSYPLKGKDDGKVSVPDKTKNAASGSTWTNVQDPVYLTFTTGSGLKYYAVAADKTSEYNNTLYVRDNPTATPPNYANAVYPYLGDVTDANGTSSTYYGSNDYLEHKLLPVSNAAYVQPYIPSYCIVEVSNSTTGAKTITFSTYPIVTASGHVTGAEEGYSFNANTPYDKITVSK